MANNTGNTLNLSNEVDQFLQLMEEMLKLAVKFNQPRKPTQDRMVGLVERQNIESGLKGVDADIENKIIEKMDSLMHEFSTIRRETITKMNTKNIQAEMTTTLIESVPNSLIEKENLLVLDISELEKMTESTQTLLNNDIHERDTNEADKKSFLRSFGEKMIQLDEKRLAITDSINDYFSNFTTRTREGFGNWVINHLQDINNKVESMKATFTQQFLQESPIQADQVEVPIKQDIASDLSSTNGIQPLVEEKTLMEKIAGIIHALENNMATIKRDIELVDDLLKETQQVVGVRTELDPKVGVFEPLNGNEKSGLKTVTSVKEEIEDITLTDYSPHEEEAYHEGVDPDPNVATQITDEEWADSQDFER